MTSSSQAIVVGGVPEHFNLPWHLALETNSFQAAGLQVTYQDVPGGTGAMTRGLREGQLDMAIVLTEGGVADLLKGNPSRIVKTYVESPLIWGIHVPAASELKSVDDIQGQRYAISRFGSGSHLMAIVDAAERGWETDDLRFEKVGDLTGARKALGNQDAEIFFWERFTTSPYVQSGEFRRVGERLTPWPAFVVCATEKLLQERSEDVKTVLEIINRQCDDLMKRQDACEVISQRYGLMLSDVREWFSRTVWSTDFTKPAAAIKSATNYLSELDLVPRDAAGAVEVWQQLG